MFGMFFETQCITILLSTVFHNALLLKIDLLSYGLCILL